MTNPGKDVIAERYQQEKPESARLVTEEARSSSKKTGSDSVKQKRRSNSANTVEEKPSKAGAAKKSGKKSTAGAKKSTNAAKNCEALPEEQSQTVKTPSVMKLVEDKPLSENQVIAAGKSQIPRQLRGIEPLSRVLRREADAMNNSESARNSPQVTRNLTEMAVEQNAPEILRRFNACDCERCREELIRLAAAEIPARYKKLPELADLSFDGFSKEERLLVESLKKTAVSVMIRLMIGNKKRNFHG